MVKDNFLFEKKTWEDLKKREEKLYSIRTFLHYGTSPSSY